MAYSQIKEQDEKAPLPKISLLLQIGGEIYEHLYVLMTPYKSF